MIVISLTACYKKGLRFLREVCQEFAKNCKRFLVSGVEIADTGCRYFHITMLEDSLHTDISAAFPGSLPEEAGTAHREER